MSETIKIRAHGRVNLIGEHTDYNGGWVLPTSIPQYIEVTLTRRSDHWVKVKSSMDQKHHLPREDAYELGHEAPSGSWIDYLMGATKLLREKGEVFGGADVFIESTVPEGSGLSSSAALEISFLKAIREAFKLKLEDVELALLGQRIENEFVGARVGIMDQMAACLAKWGEALFLDAYTLQYERVPLPLDEIDLMVINSGISHKLSEGDGGYNKRRAQCEEASALLGIKHLRDISLTELGQKELPPLLMKRARHVVSENERVHEAVRAIKERNWKKLGDLFLASHASMKDDYEVSISEIDLLVELCMQHQGVYGARLTGGGFGGSIVAIMQKGLAETVSAKVIKEYEARTGVKGAVLVKGDYGNQGVQAKEPEHGNHSPQLWGDHPERQGP